MSMPHMTSQVSTARVPYKKIAVIGFGVTGQSVIRYLSDSTSEVIAMDTRELTVNTRQLKRLFPKVRLVTGGLDQHTLESADMVVVSPGVSVHALDLHNKIGPQTELVGDIELFARYADAPIIAITGSNGKSTVATLVDILINAGGKTALLGGNIGVPALDLFDEPTPDVYVLELSSFQLETTDSLKADVAVVLNLSEDHLDRYPTYLAYTDAKARVYRNARSEVINRDEPSAPQIVMPHSVSFGLGEPRDEHEFGIINEGGINWLAQGDRKILEAERLSLKGRQNWLNALASIAIVKQFGMNINDTMLEAMCVFEGLVDRCEQVASEQGVLWINDSKGTNVGATLAAIAGFEQPKILIMGGQGKGADFTPLKSAMDESVREVILIGQDADKLEAVLMDVVKVSRADSLEEAVLRAKHIAREGEVVMLSPACASFDMFEHYKARGEAFRRLVSQHVLGRSKSVVVS
jgi:UDP-N-acetylmuramoylalanine--D-glutamate ligase